MTCIRISIPLASSFLIILLLVLMAEELVILFSSAASVVDSTINSSLNERHLIVAFTKTHPVQVKVIRNATTGDIVDVSGVIPLMLSWLSLEYNFTWSILQSKEDFDVGNKDDARQLRYYLENGMCDLVVGALAPIHSRFEWMDFLHGYVDGTAAMIIPKPQPYKSNISAIAKPFQSWVWIGLFLAFICTLFAFLLIYRYLLKYQNPAMTNELERRTSQLVYYVIRLVLNQNGGFLASRRLTPRLVAGSWCLLAFFIITAYQSVLISYILAPVMQPPIVNSFADLANKSDVKLIVEKGLSIDSLLTSYAASTVENKATSSTALENVYRSLGQRLDNDPESRCTSQQRCIDLVKRGKSVYVRAISSATHLIEKDFQDSGGGHCNLVLAKDKWSTATLWGWAVRKKSPYMEAFNIGILRMNEAGLTEKWRLGFEKGGSRCVGNGAANSNSQSQQTRRLTIEDMSCSFVILLVGIFSSVAIFIIELILRRRESTIAAVADEVIVNKDDENAAKIINQPAPSAGNNKLKETCAAELLINDEPDNNESTATIIVDISSPIPTNLNKMSVLVEIISEEEPSTINKQESIKEIIKIDHTIDAVANKIVNSTKTSSEAASSSSSDEELNKDEDENEPDEESRDVYVIIESLPIKNNHQSAESVIANNPPMNNKSNNKLTDEAIINLIGEINENTNEENQ